MENVSRALIMAGAILIALLIISLGVFVFTKASSTVSKSQLNSQSARSHNSSFESYFGNDVSSADVKSLLSQVRTNNMSANNNKEPYVIGICFVSIDTTASENKGIYTYEVDPENMRKSTFDSLNFYTDIQNVINRLKATKTYIINVPNSRAFKNDKSGRSGFEKDSTPSSLGTTGTAQNGKTGGYYSNGYIRLIYIIDNDNLGCSQPKLK